MHLSVIPKQGKGHLIDLVNMVHPVFVELAEWRAYRLGSGFTSLSICLFRLKRMGLGIEIPGD